MGKLLITRPKSVHLLLISEGYVRRARRGTNAGPALQGRHAEGGARRAEGAERGRRGQCPPPPSKEVTSATAWMLARTSYGIEAEGWRLMARMVAGSSLGSRSAVSRPLASCSVSVSWV